MSKVAVILADGFEESEAITIADILKRAQIECNLIGLDKEVITGGHDIKVKCDYVLSDDIKSYDMIVLPGGYDGVANQMGSKKLLEILEDMNKNNKYIAAMCAAPLALSKTTILQDKSFTVYPGYDQKIKVGNFLNDIVVVDKNLITSRGPATTYDFAYKIVEVLGSDFKAVQDRMMFFSAFEREVK